MTLEELIEIAKHWEPSEEYLKAYDERFGKFCEDYDKLVEDFKLY